MLLENVYTVLFARGASRQYNSLRMLSAFISVPFCSNGFLKHNYCDSWGLGASFVTMQWEHELVGRFWEP